MPQLARYPCCPGQALADLTVGLGLSLANAWTRLNRPVATPRRHSLPWSIESWLVSTVVQLASSQSSESKRACSKPMTQQCCDLEAYISS